MKIIITASTVPVSDADKVPSFVKDQAIALKEVYPDLQTIIHAPHSSHSQILKHNDHNTNYREVRFHYFWPFKWELLTGRGIMPALKSNKLLYLQIPFLFLFQFTSMLRLTIKEKPDLIYAHWFTPQAITTAFVSAITKTPFVFTTHSGDVIVLRHLPFSKQLVRWVCKKSAGFTAVSQQTLSKMQPFFKHDDQFADKVRILPMGTTMKYRKTIQNPENRYTILFIGRHVSIKGIDLLLESFDEINNPSAKLVIAGEGQETKNLKKLAQRLKNSHNISFAGHVSGGKKYKVFSQADIVCIPSRREGQYTEGLPVVLIEALMMRKIVVASTATGAQEHITDGKNGFIFTQGSKQALCDALNKALTLSEKEANAVKEQAGRIGKSFDWPVVAKKYMSFFKQDH